MEPRVSVGLEEGADGWVMAHALSLPGCAAAGPTPQEAVRAMEGALFAWLRLLAARGEAVPAAGAEIELAVDEWVPSGARVAAGETAASFEADETPLPRAEAERLLHRLGDLRGRLLQRVRRRPDALLEAETAGGMTARQVLEALARAQWWTLTRLGASPMAEVPEGTLARLDTAMALVVDRVAALDDAARARGLEIDGERWTARRVLRHLLWLEWTLGGAALGALAGVDTERGGTG